MFIAHMASFLGMIALATGVFLYAWAANSQRLAKIFGVLIMLFSLMGLGCISYTSYTMWKAGCPCSTADKAGCCGDAKAPCCADDAKASAKSNVDSSSRHKKN